MVGEIYEASTLKFIQLTQHWRSSKILHFIEILISSAFTLPWKKSWSYRNQPTDFQSKSMDCFLYDDEFRHERVKKLSRIPIS